MRETPVYAPPIYCTRDGMQLQEGQFIVPLGYDPFTGLKADELHAERSCPTKKHDIWRVYGNKWIKVDR